MCVRDWRKDRESCGSFSYATANDTFAKWLARGWLHPSDLSRMSADRVADIQARSERRPTAAGRQVAAHRRGITSYCPGPSRVATLACTRFKGPLALARTARVSSVILLVMTDYDEDKIDEAVLALLYLGSTMSMNTAAELGRDSTGLR